MYYIAVGLWWLLPAPRGWAWLFLEYVVPLQILVAIAKWDGTGDA